MRAKNATIKEDNAAFHTGQLEKSKNVVGKLCLQNISQPVSDQIEEILQFQLLSYSSKDTLDYLSNLADEG